MTQQRSKLVEYLESCNYEMAINLYKEHPEKLTDMVALELARAFLVCQDYQACAAICEQFITSTNPQVYFDAFILLIKSRYLCGFKVHPLIVELQVSIKKSQKNFNINCVNSLREVRQAIEFHNQQLSAVLNKVQLLQFGKDFKNQLEQDSFDNPLTDCMPVFLVSTRWIRLFQNHTKQQGQHPGPITHFQVVDHRYSLLHDPSSQKKYSNTLIYPGAAVTSLPRSCWNFLRKHFQGTQLKRYNIWISGKPREVMTEIYLKKIKVKKENQNTIFELQITKKETWGGVVKKLKNIWTNCQSFWIFQQTKSKKNPLRENIFLEEANVADKIYIFKQLQVASENLTKNLHSSCQNCGNTIGLKFCQCKTVKYCNSKCQKDDRDKHRKKCEIQCQHMEQKSAAMENFNLQQKGYSGRKGIVGLKNLGNTCYMNSGLQCLSNAKEITQYFMKNDFLKQINHNNPLGTKGNLACAYAELIRQIWTGSESTIAPFNLKKIIGRFAGQFSGYGQQDSQQFISYLIDGLQEDLNLVKNKQNFEATDEILPDDVASRKSELNFQKRTKSYIRDLMVGQFKSTVICQKCQKVSICFDPFLLLTLPIPTLKDCDVFFVSMDSQRPTKRLSFTYDSSSKILGLRRQLTSLYKLNDVRLMFSIVDLRNFSVLATQIKDSFTINQINNKLTNQNIVLMAHQIKNLSAGEKLYEISYIFQDVQKCFPRFINLKQQVSNQDIAKILGPSVSRYISARLSQEQAKLKNFIDTVEKTQGKVIFRLKKSIDMLICSSEQKQLKLLTRDRRLNLYDCLASYANKQFLDGNNKWYCNRCKNHQRALKQMQVYNANKILVIAFKRFSRGFKVKQFVDFPIEDLNMGPYIRSNADKKQIMYDLFGIVNHYGTMSGGHYTAFCKNFIDNNWYEFDDSRVSRISARQAINESAYVLFYRRRQ